MATSLYKIAEQVRSVIEKRESIQVLIVAVTNAYASSAKKQWYENTQADEQMIDGSFVNTFKGLVPACESDTERYFITIPSSYLMLPHQMGIVWVSNMKDSLPWIKINNWGLFSGLKANLMGGRQVYQIEGNNMYFPKMNKTNCNCSILLKLAIAYDNIDPYTELNIAPNIVEEIVKNVVAQYSPKVNPVEQIRESIN